MIYDFYYSVPTPNFPHNIRETTKDLKANIVRAHNKEKETGRLEILTRIRITPTAIEQSLETALFTLNIQ